MSGNSKNWIQPTFVFILCFSHYSDAMGLLLSNSWRQVIYGRSLNPIRERADLGLGCSFHPVLFAFIPASGVAPPGVPAESLACLLRPLVLGTS